METVAHLALLYFLFLVGLEEALMLFFFIKNPSMAHTVSQLWVQ
jgi:hypothetical protein